MNVGQILDTMASKAIGDTFLEGVRDLYRKNEYGATEDDYESGMAVLKAILPADLKTSMQEMESAYEKRRKFAAVYGFKCGIYGAFRQHFSQHSAQDGGFQDLVADDLLKQPKMQRHHDNYEMVEQCNRIDEMLRNALNEADQAHLTAVVCALDQRVYSAAMDGFYCGYRAAYDLMDAVTPLARIQNMDKILTTEYYLGYIKPYSEVERLRDRAA